MKIFVVGFEEETPGWARVPIWSAPVLADEDGCRVVKIGRSYERVSDLPIPWESIKTATQLERHPYHGGYVLVVLSKDAKILYKHHFTDAKMWKIRRAYCAFLLPRKKGREALSILRDLAIQQAARIILSGSRRNLYGLGWQVARCSVHREDTYLAALILSKSAYPTMGRTFLNGFRPISKRIDAKYTKLAEKRLQKVIRSVRRQKIGS